MDDQEILFKRLKSVYSNYDHHDHHLKSDENLIDISNIVIFHQIFDLWGKVTKWDVRKIILCRVKIILSSRDDSIFKKWWSFLTWVFFLLSQFYVIIIIKNRMFMNLWNRIRIFLFEKSIFVYYLSIVMSKWFLSARPLDESLEVRSIEDP